MFTYQILKIAVYNMNQSCFFFFFFFFFVCVCVCLNTDSYFNCFSTKSLILKNFSMAAASVYMPMEV